jgi:hypothetical protein
VNARRSCIIQKASTADTEVTQQLNWAFLLPRQAVAMAAAGAALGPLLDGLHSSNDVLHYHHPTVLRLGSVWQLETCW